jgi:hypothetical protein
MKLEMTVYGVFCPATSPAQFCWAANLTGATVELRFNEVTVWANGGETIGQVLDRWSKSAGLVSTDDNTFPLHVPIHIQRSGIIPFPPVSEFLPPPSLRQHAEKWLKANQIQLLKTFSLNYTGASSTVSLNLVEMADALEDFAETIVESER